MHPYSLSHLSDQVLLRDLAGLVAQDRVTTAALLAHLAEVDARRLYAPAGYPSIHAWCVGKLRLSEDSAAKRIQAARAARRFPAIFPMVAEGRLHLSAVGLLAPHFTQETAGELLAAAVHKTKAQIERLLAERFPRPDSPSLVTPLAVCENGEQHAPGHVILTVPGQLASCSGASARDLALAADAGSVAQPTPGQVVSGSQRQRLAPLSPGRFALQVTVAQETHDKLRYAQSLLGHAVPSGDFAQVLDRALDSLITKLEQRKFAACARTRSSGKHRAHDTRYVPAHIRRDIWQRDGGRCTFVSQTGHRCEASARLEFDHIEPYARGGQATATGLRLRCHAHNQLEAERAYGPEFMRHKRDASRKRAEAARATKTKSDVAPTTDAAHVLRERESATARHARQQEVIPWLRALGVRADEAKRAVAFDDVGSDAPLETRVRAALTQLAPAGACRASSC